MRERKFRNPRRPKRAILVICEGETEEVYVNSLRQEYRLPISIVTKVSGNRINRRLVTEYTREMEMERGDNIDIFYIYDGDVQCIVDKLQDLPGTLIINNPCIELWFLLHFSTPRNHISSAEVVRQLKAIGGCWANYAKRSLSAEQTRQLVANRSGALARASALEAGRNPSSGMPIFIKVLEESKSVNIPKNCRREC